MKRFVILLSLWGVLADFSTETRCAEPTQIKPTITILLHLVGIKSGSRTSGFQLFISICGKPDWSEMNSNIHFNQLNAVLRNNKQQLHLCGLI